MTNNKVDINEKALHARRLLTAYSRYALLEAEAKMLWSRVDRDSRRSHSPRFDGVPTLDLVKKSAYSAVRWVSGTSCLVVTAICAGSVALAPEIGLGVGAVGFAAFGTATGVGTVAYAFAEFREKKAVRRELADRKEKPFVKADQIIEAAHLEAQSRIASFRLDDEAKLFRTFIDVGEVDEPYDLTDLYLAAKAVAREDLDLNRAVNDRALDQTVGLTRGLSD